MDEFSHGGDIEQFSNDINCNISDVIDLSSNINCIKPNITIDFNSIDISHYPTYNLLEDKVSKLYNVSTGEIELFNGASSAIFSLFRLFDTRHCYIYSPAYLEYKKASKLFDFTTEYINRFTDLYSDVSSNSLVIFVNPSTPDGQYYDINRLLNIWMKKNCTILIDESFLEFTSFDSATSHIPKYDKLYILKSMTKFYSSAGIRIGAVLSSAQNISKLKDKEPKWKISQFDQHYILNVLKDKEFPKISKVINIKNKELLTNVLKSSKYILNISDSSANYLLIMLKDINAKEFQEKLSKFKIMIRDCSNFDYLDDSFIRIAVKSEKDINALKEALISIETQSKD